MWTSLDVEQDLDKVNQHLRSSCLLCTERQFVDFPPEGKFGEIRCIMQNEFVVILNIPHLTFNVNGIEQACRCNFSTHCTE